MSLDPSMAFNLACFSSLSLSDFTHNSGDIVSAHPSPPSSITGSTTTTTTTSTTSTTSNGTYETARCSQHVDLDDLMNPFLPNIEALDIDTQLLSGPLLPNPLSQDYNLFPSLAMPAGPGPVQSIPPADSTWASITSFQLDATSALAPPAPEAAPAPAPEAPPAPLPAPSSAPAPLPAPARSAPATAIQPPQLSWSLEQDRNPDNMQAAYETQALHPDRLFEDTGNDGDTEDDDAESAPMFRFRSRRQNMRIYTGDALVSLDDIQDNDNASRRNRNRRTNTGRARARGGLPRRRPPYKNRLSKQIRAEIASLTGMDQGKSLVSVCEALSNNELNAFASIWEATGFHHMHPTCCDINNFFIDLVYTPRSPWNQSASRVFTVHFIKKYRLSQSDNMMNIVQEAFFVRIKTLQASLRRLTAGQEAIELSLQSTRRWLRKQTTFNNRMIATAHPLLQHHRPILLRLGVAGMSTDESDQEPLDGRGRQAGVKTYHVRVPVWRNSQLTAPLRWMDKLYLIIRRMSKTLRGALPRIRIAPDMETELSIRAQAYEAMVVLRTRVKFVNDLPKCAYDGTWFGVFVGDGFDLRYTNEEFNFTVDLELLQFVERYMSFNPRMPA